MAAELNERFERLDVLVNNAGVLPLRRQATRTVLNSLLR
jgi:NAD(P)-dependent dehydrogenase (short-subunit alcohol dehydrogenase family)